MLDTLPLEILFIVISFATPEGVTAETRPIHAWNALAVTCKRLNMAVEEYARGLLKQHADFTPHKSSKTFTYRKKWTAGTCQMCNKSSKRGASLNRIFTCCRACDRKYFLKMTMTQAKETYKLSKLDILTPNRLHPSLPPLAVGEIPSMGPTAILISEPDLIARRDLIHVRLGAKNSKDSVYLRRRIAAHERLITHMDIYYCLIRRTWMVEGRLQRENYKDKPAPSKSMQTKESRKEYIERGLRKEWAAMGMDRYSKAGANELNQTRA